MIQIKEPLIIPPDQEKNRKKLTARLKKRSRSVRTVFCIILPTTEGGLLEVIPLYALRFEAKDHDVTVLGVCEGREAALQTVESMIGEVYKETGALDIRAYYNA